MLYQKCSRNHAADSGWLCWALSILSITAISQKTRLEVPDGESSYLKSFWIRYTSRIIMLVPYDILTCPHYPFFCNDFRKECFMSSFLYRVVCMKQLQILQSIFNLYKPIEPALRSISKVSLVSLHKECERT